MLRFDDIPEVNIISDDISIPLWYSQTETETLKMICMRSVEKD